MLKQLLVNSAKYCPGCKISIRAADGKISVRDDGCGVKAHELPRLTERGFTGGGRTGTGMGLYIVAQLCETLDVGLEIASEEGVYTETTLHFPSFTKS